MIENIQPILMYTWFIALAGFGGMAKALVDARRLDLKVTFKSLFIDFFVSSFTGMVTLYILLSMNASIYTIGALVAISGHMGPRTWVFFEAKFKAFFGGERPNKR